MKIENSKKQNDVIPAQAGIHGSRITLPATLRWRCGRECGMTEGKRGIAHNFKKYSWLFILTFLLFNFLLPKIALADATWSINTSGDLVNQFNGINIAYKIFTEYPITIGSYKGAFLTNSGSKYISVVIVVSSDKKTVKMAGAEIAGPSNPSAAKSNCVQTNVNGYICQSFDALLKANPNSDSDIAQVKANPTALKYVQYLMSLNNVAIDGSASATTAATPAAATTPAATNNSNNLPSDAAASDTSWKSKMPINANSYNTDWLAVILSVIIGILAITVPWGMMSEVTNAIKSGYNALTKGAGKQISDKMGLGTAAKERFYKIRGTKTGQAIASRYRQAFGRGKRIDEALQKQSGDIEQLTNNTIYQQALIKANGNWDRLDPRFQALGKSSGGKAMENTNEWATSKDSDQLSSDFINKKGVEILKGSYEGDGSLIAQAKVDDLDDIRSSHGALVKQLHSSNPVDQTRARKALENIADQIGISFEQLVGTDMRTFRVPKAVDKPDTPITQRGDTAPHRKKFNENYQASLGGTVTIDPTSITELARKMTDIAVDEGANANLAFNETEASLRNNLRARGITGTPSATDTITTLGEMDRDLQSAITALNSGRHTEAITTMTRLGLPVNQMMANEPEKLKNIAKQATFYIGSRMASPGSTAVDITTARDAARDSTIADSKYEQTAALIKQQTKIGTIDAATIKAIHSGTALPGNFTSLSANQQNFIREAVLGSATGPTPRPGLIT